MAYKVRCTACGKSVRLPESDAGMSVVCLACGTKFEAPPTDRGVPVPDATLARSAPVAKPAPSSPTPVAAPPEFAKEPHQRRFSIGWVLAACALVLLFGGVGITIYRLYDKTAGKKQMAVMLKEAEALASRGEFQSAYEKYRDIDRRAGEIGVDDPEVKKLADQARNEQEMVFSYLKWQSPPAATPVPSPATAPSIAKLPDAGGSNPPPVGSTTLPADPAPATTEANESDTRAPPPAPVPPAPRSPTESAATTKPDSDETDTSSTTRSATRRLHPMPERASGVTDEQIGRAIQKGVDNLFDKFDLKTGQLRKIDAAGDEGYACGLNALCVYALLQSGQAISDPRLDVRGQYMPLFIDGMKSLRANNGTVTYARGIRATALALYNRKEDRSALRADVTYLLMTHHEGAYGYRGDRVGSSVKGTPGRWDNSNSQYGLLGVWSGAEVDIEVPNEYWAAVNKHWTETQSPSGMWAYHHTLARDGSISMTAAGTASMFVADDYLNGAKFGLRVGREPFSPPLKRALDWWEKEGNFDVSVTGWWGYTLYGIERVGLASGFKYFGKRDWYREIAREVVARQMLDGTWGDVVDSAYALLFLARGRHPILMNKLRFDRGGATGEIAGFWGNRPRDAANLARYAGKQLERPLNWQVVGLDREWYDWLDSPVLSIASHRAPYFTDADVTKFRNYAEAGGMLFLQADGDSAEFDEFAKAFAKRVFPQYPMTDLPPGHLLYNVLYKVDPPPPLKAVSNGARVLLLYAPQDMTRWWQVRDERAKEWAFKQGINLFVYSAGKRELRNRLNSPYISAPSESPPMGKFGVARVKYEGAWDPEPGAWRRFANWFVRRTGTGIAVETVPMSKLSTSAARVAHLTGIAAYQPTEPEKRELRAFVDRGGVLLVDSCGASSDFANSIKTALEETFPQSTFGALPRRHPMLDPGAAGMDDLRRPRLRPFVAEKSRTADPNATLQVLQSGSGLVLLSDIDIISGLLGTQTWGIYGYEPDYAQSLVKNLIFWTIDGKPSGAAASTAR